MSQIPAATTRVPSFMASQLMLRNITGTSVSLLGTQEQLATGRRVNRTSDDPTAAALIMLLNTRLDQAGQRARNLDHAGAILNTTDQAIANLSDAVLESRTIASSQVGVGSDTATRSLQANVIAALRQEVFNAMNSDYVGVSLFAGSKTGSPAFEFFKGGYRYLGDADGMHTDLGGAIDFPITLGADGVVGATSTRVEGAIDLNPVITATTLLSDLRGPMSGKELGTLTIQIDDGSVVTEVAVDVSDAETVDDLNDMVTAAITSALGSSPVGIAFDPDRISVAVAGGYTVTFDDGPAGSTATALGLANFTFDNANPTNPDPASDLDPAVTDATLLGSLNPTTALAFGDIRFRNGANTGTVTIDAAMTIGDLREAVAALDLGVEIELSTSGNGIDVINHVSGLAMSIEEVAGGTSASTLGIRSLDLSTAIADFNGGRGVEIADGVNDPDSGLPDPAYNNDFEVRLSDGTTFTVDLTPDDMATVADVLAKIEADAALAGITVPAQFSATLAPDGNGIAFADTLGGPDAITITGLNGHAAEDLGLMDGAGAPGSLLGADVAQAEVDSIFTTLLRLEQSLTNDDVRGITFAGGELEADLDRLTTAQALVGTRAARLQTQNLKLEEQTVLDEKVRSELRDTDFVAAASRFSLLQTQLQAAMTVTAQASTLSLINFLG